MRAAEICGAWLKSNSSSAFHSRQLGFEDATRNRTALALFQFRGQQRFQVTHRPILLFYRLVGQAAKLRRHRRQPQ